MYWNTVVTFVTIFHIHPCISSSVGTNLNFNHVKSYNNRLDYLSPEKCKLNERTKFICRILSKSTRVKTIQPQSMTFANFNQNGLHFPAYGSKTMTNTPRNSLSGLLRKRDNLLTYIWPTLNKWTQVPLFISGAPLLLTLSSALLFSQIKNMKFNRRMKRIRGSISEEDSEEDKTIEEEELEQKSKRKEITEKLGLAKEIVNLTAETYANAAYKLEFLHILSGRGSTRLATSGTSGAPRLPA